MTRQGIFHMNHFDLAWAKSSYWDNNATVQKLPQNGLPHWIIGNCIWSAGHANSSLENDSDHHAH